MRFRNLLLIQLILHLPQFGMSQGLDFQEQALTITLDELTNNEIPDEIWDSLELTELSIQKTQPKPGWKTYPPLSWYKSVEFTPPYWVLSNKIGQLRSLKTLSIVDLDLRTLPDSIIHLSKLEHINLSFNKIDLGFELDKFRQLKSLKRLTAYGNHYDEAVIQAFKSEFPNILVEYKDENN